ncbi:DUF4333 domain-containing protein [Cellulomonas soli]|uniref:DUF4333 domain-containing protein n=1 Tax=Cellulomonas soli TaxID=931535 RepID=A0A512PI79_9CELL|nr:DUF4333 domain-containing protein [Cellulomonas soli]NYI58721.1 hypothetical protein [Cellulomonas soli]GEP70896.1 hypothetical protein CSO01_36110 [Cellulomonas soli]
MRSATTAGLTAVLLLVLTSACSFSATTSTQVGTGELETQVSSMLQEQVGVAPDSVDCPDPLPGEAGSEVRCTLTASGVTYGLTATSNGVEGDAVNISVQVDDQPVEGQG